MSGKTSALQKAAQRALDAARLRATPDIAEMASERGSWLVVTIEQDYEDIAAAHLSGRGFGIFVPGMYVRGKWLNMLPGYIFVQVFGIEHHRRRILACPGIVDFIYEMGHPSCPFVVPDEFIVSMRQHEKWDIESRQTAAYAMACGETAKKRARRRRKSKRIRKREKLAA